MPGTHRVVALMLGLLVLPWLAGCAAPTVVHVRDYRFDPPHLSVAEGHAVKFISDGTAAHTVTVRGPDGGVLEDKQIATGESVDVTFAKSGAHQVSCRIHADMRMTVNVA